MKMERVMILTIDRNDWNMPKSILIPYKGSSDRLETIAKELFAEYKSKNNKDDEFDINGLELLNYKYYGDLIIPNC